MTVERALDAMGEPTRRAIMAAMSAILGAWQVRAVGRNGGTAVAGLGTWVSRTIEVTVPAAEILRHGTDTAAVLGRSRVTAVDEATGTISLPVNMSWRSWGNGRVGCDPGAGVQPAAAPH